MFFLSLLVGIALCDYVPQPPHLGQSLYTQAIEALSSTTGTPQESKPIDTDIIVDIAKDFTKRLFNTELTPKKYTVVLDDPDWQQYKEIPQIHSTDSTISKKAKAIKLLHVAAYQESHQPSLGALGDIYLLNQYGIVRNATLSFEHYLALANHGNSTGFRMVALMYATGVGVARDYPKALVYASFGALEGDIQAHHMLGYWHYAGVGVQSSCDKAVWYYEQVADHAIKMSKSGPPGGRSIPREKVLLHGRYGGIYGKGASGSGNPTIKTAANGGMKESDILMLYRLQAESGDASSQVLPV
jgi:SEL1 protein